MQSITTWRSGAASVAVRSAVTFREQMRDDEHVLYLSLYADEADERFADYCDRLERYPDNPGLCMELTDAVVHARTDGGVRVQRGAAATFPLYWHHDGRCVHLSTRLPLEDAGRLNAQGLLASMAAALLPGSHEPNFLDGCPLAGWKRIRRGSVSRFAPGETSPRWDWIVHPVPETAALPDNVHGQIQAAFSAYGRSQRRVERSALELSGGYDSTLAAAAALRGGHRMLGVSVIFPYYEFRFEEPVQAAVGESLAIPRALVDGTDLLPYSPPDHLPRFDEPALFMTGIRHAEVVARLASEHRATHLYTGHGGDHVFATDLTVPERVGTGVHRRALNWKGRRQLAPLLASLNSPPLRSRKTGCYLYDGRQDVWVKERFDLTLRTPFTDLAVFRSGLAWSSLCGARGEQPDKSVLDEAVGHLLPDAVRRRYGKVAYDGVWMRAYARHGSYIAGMIDRTAGILERIGLRPAWLIWQARDLADWKPAAAQEILGAYAIATWLASWGLDCAEALRDISPD
jgi:hypothetical protein